MTPTPARLPVSPIPSCDTAIECCIKPTLETTTDVYVSGHQDQDHIVSPRHCRQLTTTAFCRNCASRPPRSPQLSASSAGPPRARALLCRPVPCAPCRSIQTHILSGLCGNSPSRYRSDTASHHCPPYRSDKLHTIAHLTDLIQLCTALRLCPPYRSHTALHHCPPCRSHTAVHHCPLYRYTKLSLSQIFFRM